MSKEKKQGLAYNNLEAITETKEQYIHLCKMFKKLGVILKIQSKEIHHPHFSTTILPQTHRRVLYQFSEIGQQLETTGACLDLLGGKKVMKKEEEPKKEFISNIKPNEKEKEEEEKEDKKETDK